MMCRNKWCEQKSNIKDPNIFLREKIGILLEKQNVYFKTREDDLREAFPHSWVSSNDYF